MPKDQSMHQNFFRQLTIYAIMGLGVIWGLNFIGQVFRVHQLLSWISWCFFVVICVIAYWLGLKAYSSHNKNDFTNLFIVLITAKMFFSLFTILIYKILAEPENKLFVLPFLIMYLIFTFFESHVLIKIGKSGVF